MEVNDNEITSAQQKINTLQAEIDEAQWKIEGIRREIEYVLIKMETATSENQLDHSGTGYETTAGEYEAISRERDAMC
jgi:phage shock protein A